MTKTAVSVLIRLQTRLTCSCRELSEASLTLYFLSRSIHHLRSGQVIRPSLHLPTINTMTACRAVGSLLRYRRCTKWPLKTLGNAGLSNETPALALSCQLPVCSRRASAGHQRGCDSLLTRRQTLQLSLRAPFSVLTGQMSTMRELKDSNRDLKIVLKQDRGVARKTPYGGEDEGNDDGRGNDGNDDDYIVVPQELVVEQPELEADSRKIFQLLSAFRNVRRKDLLNEYSTVLMLLWIKQYHTRTRNMIKKASMMHDSFASVGGVQITYEIYQQAMAAIQEKVVTETALWGKNDDDPTTMRARIILCAVRSIWLNGTDMSGLFVQALAGTGYLIEVLEEIETMYEGTDMDVEKRKCLDTSLAMLHNIARRVDTKDQVAKLKLEDSGKSAVDVCANIVSTTDRQELRLSALLTLSYIIDKESKEQMVLLKADHELDFLLECMRDAFTSKVSRDQFGFRFDELLSGLRNLAENDDSSRYLVKKGVLKELVPILKDGNDAEKEQACDILYELAMTEGNTEEIHKDKDILGLLKLLENHSDDSVQTAAKKTIFVWKRSLEESNKGFTEQENSPSVKEAPTTKHDTPGGHVMLSYSWNNQDKVLWIRDKLKERNYRVWVDVDDLKGNLKEAMAAGVEDASFVLLCFSKSYADSKNCKKECDYADDLGKLTIPLKMEEIKPRGWLGISIAGKKHFDFSDHYPDQDKTFEELIKELQAKDKN